jgi:protein TonB
MFENYVVAKKTKLPRWAFMLLVGVVALHGTAGAGLLVYSWLKIEKLETPDTGVKASLDLPPPPPPPKGSNKQHLEAKKDPTPHKIKPVDTVQPEKRKAEDPTPPSEADEPEGDPNGEEGGQVGGVVGGQVGGVVGGVVTAPPPPPPPPPPPAKVQTVTPQALAANRVSGDAQIAPADVTKTEIQRSGKTRIVVPFKICVGTNGSVKSVKILKSSGFPAYDSKIENEAGDWKYKPFLVDGVPTPVCTAVTIIYVQNK